MTPYYQAPGVELHLGDFREVLWGGPTDPYVNAFDAVITDPPYPREFLPLWGPLGRCSARSLKRGGSLLAITPHYALPEVLDAVNDWLKYRWIIAMWQAAGAHPRMAMGIEVTFKPILWWVKGGWPRGRGFRRDGFANAAPAKKLHRWEQSDTWAYEMLKYVPAGGRILDPMAGAGTLLVAAQRLGHPVVGIDIDEACLEITAKRMEAGTNGNATDVG